MFYTLSDKKTTSFEYILRAHNLRSSGWPVQAAPVQDTNQSEVKKKFKVIQEWGQPFCSLNFHAKNNISDCEIKVMV